jgi:hypothetical protein
MESKFKRFLKAKSACQTIAKRGTNSFQNYSYVMEADIVSLVNKACEENNLFWVASYHDMQQSIFISDKQKTNLRTSCRCILQVFDVESGELVAHTESFGDSLDTSDKSIYKTQTGAKKYALMALFGIATYNDPEEDSPLINEKAGKALVGEKVVYKYQIPAKNMQENSKLEDYVMDFKNVKYNASGDALIETENEVRKLNNFLIKE